MTLMKALCLALTLLPAIFVSTVAQTTGMLEGTVVDEEGKPIIGATISVVGSSTGTYSRVPDGTFCLSEMPPGEHRIKVTSVGRTPETFSVWILDGETTILEVRMKPLEVLCGPLYCSGVRPISPDQSGTIIKITDEESDRNPRGTSVIGMAGLTTGVQVFGAEAWRK